MSVAPRVLVAALVSLYVLAGCTKDAPTQAAAADTTRVAPTIEERIDSLLVQMTLDEKIGQMTQAERSDITVDTLITYYGIGSLLSGGGSAPSDNSAQGWANMCDGYQRAALKTRLKIPLIYGADAVHGHNNVLGAVIFPHNIGLGCTNNPELVRQVERVVAEEVAGTGVNWTFGPCIAVPRDERWGRTYEGFSESPDLTMQMSPAAVEGFQGALGGSNSLVLACTKHYLGDGGTTKGANAGDVQVDEQTMRRIHLPGYTAAVQSRVGSVMASFSSWNGVKMTSSAYWMSTVLKGELGFNGCIVSDWLAIEQMPGDYATQIATAINAGIDMGMEPGRFRNFITTLKQLVTQGRVPMDRINDAVRRILRKKLELGLFDHPFADRTLTSTVGSPQHRAVARDAVRKSMVLLKNSDNILPLSKNLKRIHVAGKNADDLGNQCGGWTISWQGRSGAITTGTTILQAIKNAVSAGTTVTYSRDGSGASGADVCIVVIGEAPYAESYGDRSDLSLSSEDVLAAANAKSAGANTVVVLVSGRPMILGATLTDASAFVAAWLPGTEGQGVADVLFGDYNLTGKLSHSWPRSMSQIPINVGDASYDPLFEFGFGLHY
jgi:beta-glucosidase